MGNEENILLEAFGLSEPVVVTLLVSDYPEKNVTLLRRKVTLNSDNNYSVLKTITVIQFLINIETIISTKHFYTIAEFGPFQQVEYISKVSFLSGYIFIQTDKPIYNPGDTVRFRAFVSNPEFQAFNNTISVEIQVFMPMHFIERPFWKVHAFLVAVDQSLKMIYKCLTAVGTGSSDNFCFFRTLTELQSMLNLPSEQPTAFTLTLTHSQTLSKLPAFNVTLVPSKFHLSLEDKELKVKVYAKYLYGEKVDGVAHIVFGITNYGMNKRVSSMKQVKDVTVSHHDGSPAPNVPVKISFLSAPVKVHSGTIRVSLKMPYDFTPKTIKVNTVVPKLKPEQQAKTEWLVEPFMPFNSLHPNQLYITVDKKEAKVGDTVDFHLRLSLTSNQERSKPGQLSYTVLNKGKIIRAGKVNVTKYNAAKFSLLLTPEMVPAFRFVAYYILPLQHDVDLMADSLLVNVQSQCLGSLKVEQLRGKAKQWYSPGDRFRFQLRGDPGAKVSLVAVDTSVLLLSKSHLTQKKIWDTLGQGDLGCSSGGGRNSMGVFHDAGLNFHKSFETSTNNYFGTFLCVQFKDLISIPILFAVAPVESVLPDSITQWGILGISASASTGFCVAEPFNVRAWKPFFIKLRLPRTAARNEHVEVKAMLHNYMSKDLKVLVILSKMVNMCSVAYTEDHKQEVFVQAKSSVLIPYTVIPLKTGELPLQVTAMSRTGRDAVRKTLRVVMEGIQKSNVMSFVLNPAEKGDGGGNQVIRVKRATLSSVVPNSVPQRFVNIRGNLLADSIDNSISQDSLAALIQMPGGCVEQNLASIMLPLIAVHYLDRSWQWESVGIQRREVAISYIKTGYENQLHFRKSDNSYPPYRNEGTSTWITAFVVKVFSMAYPFITVDMQNICGPLLYLLNHKQLPSGAFKEDNPVYTTSMMVRREYVLTNGKILCRFYCIMNQTLCLFCSSLIPGVHGTVLRTLDRCSLQLMFQRAGVYLKERYHRLRRPYSVAIACYALAVSNQGCSKSVLLKSASADRKLWPDAENTFFTLEATGYALLALLKGGHVQEAAAPFQWLNQQRRVGGGFGPTQSTMVVLQALSEYLVKKPSPADMNLKVVLRVPCRSDIHQAFTKHLAHVAYSFSVSTFLTSYSSLNGLHGSNLLL
ncbi:complement component c3b, tandem duplicate 2 isoform X2 [Silurus asotus]|uniref:Complement component c3b, tandem duplicate 2 isoform X2 n=1 Tax=Silurus asotus TaxID=30991 RepID=A0AAD5B8A0_SILAS|nr:complement component c3b, tandem duplicate 2 isoform X2 [Silurus asotus]